MLAAELQVAQVDVFFEELPSSEDKHHFVHSVQVLMVRKLNTGNHDQPNHLLEKSCREVIDDLLHTHVAW